MKNRGLVWKSRSVKKYIKAPIGAWKIFARGRETSCFRGKMVLGEIGDREIRDRENKNKGQVIFGKIRDRLFLCRLF